LVEAPQAVYAENRLQDYIPRSLAGFSMTSSDTAGPRQVGSLARNGDVSPRSGQPLLAVRGVSKHFGGTQALIDAGIDVGAGEIVALLGENGAGKSTLI